MMEWKFALGKRQAVISGDMPGRVVICSLVNRVSGQPENLLGALIGENDLPISIHICNTDGAGPGDLLQKVTFFFQRLLGLFAVGNVKEIRDKISWRMAVGADREPFPRASENASKRAGSPLNATRP